MNQCFWVETHKREKLHINNLLQPKPTDGQAARWTVQPDLLAKASKDGAWTKYTEATDVSMNKGRSAQTKPRQIQNLEGPTCFCGCEHGRAATGAAGAMLRRWRAAVCALFSSSPPPLPLFSNSADPLPRPPHIIRYCYDIVTAVAGGRCHGNRVMIGGAVRSQEARWGGVKGVGWSSFRLQGDGGGGQLDTGGPGEFTMNFWVFVNGDRVSGSEWGGTSAAAVWKQMVQGYISDATV